MFKLHVSNEKSISSLQIGFNGQLKDSKYKTSEQRFQNVSLSTDQRSYQGLEV